MTTGLRPLTSLEVLDAGWLVLRRHWAVLYASSILGTAPLALALMAYFYWLGTLVVGTEDTVFYSGTAVWAVGMAVAWTVNCLARGAVTASALAGGRGEPVTFSGAWRASLQRATGGIFVGLAGFAAAWLAGSCLIAPGVFLAIGWWVARPVALTEDRPFAAALRRSWSLSDGYRGKAFVLWLLCSGMLLFAAVNLHLLVQFLIGVVAGLFGIDASGLLPYFQPKNQQYVTMLGVTAFVLVDPLKTCVDAILYLDLRIRREGADLEERLRALRPGAVALIVLLLLLAPGTASAKSVDDYAKRVREVRALVEKASRPEAVDAAAVGDLRNQLVEMPGGQKLTVRNEWLSEGLAAWGEEGDKAALVRRLEALERSLGQPIAETPKGTNAAAPVDTRQALQQVMAQPEFQQLASRNEFKDLVKGVDLSKTKNWWDSFWSWLRKTLFPPPQAKVEPPRWQWKGGEQVVYILLGIVALVLLAMLVKWILERPLQEEARAAAAA
ncbi:MAG: hypothetical protein ACO1SX_21475, partial [Actinomycetota bacterium]